MARHIPERCMRQFGYVHDIPRPVSIVPAEGIDICFMGNIANSACAITNHAVKVQSPAQCVYGYLEWYLIVSHLHIIPPIEHADDVGPSDDMLLPSPGVADQHCLQMIAIIMDNLVGLVIPDGEVYTLTSQATHIARGGPV